MLVCWEELSCLRDHKTRTVVCRRGLAQVARQERLNPKLIKLVE
jgi:hypothetical protein